MPPRHPKTHVLREVVTVLHDQVVAVPRVLIGRCLDESSELPGRHLRGPHLDALAEGESGGVLGLNFEDPARGEVVGPESILRAVS